MNILNEVLNAGGGSLVKELGKQFGLDSEAAQAAVKGLLPAIAKGMQKKSQSGNLGDIFSKLGQQNVDNYVDQPNIFGDSTAKENGDVILGDIFGNKDISRSVAKQAAESNNLDYGMMKKMLPIIAGIAFAVLSKKNQSSGGGLLGTVVKGAMGGRASGGLLASLLPMLLGRGRRQQQNSGGLESFLDFDGDGSIADDVWNLARKLF